MLRPLPFISRRQARAAIAAVAEAAAPKFSRVGIDLTDFVAFVRAVRLSRPGDFQLALLAARVTTARESLLWIEARGA